VHTTPLTHTTVMLNEAVQALLESPDTFENIPSRQAPQDGCYVDATFGRGGHSRLLLSKLSPQGRLIAFDKDTEALAEAGRIQDTRFVIKHQGFRYLGELPPASVAGVLMDLGVSSPQLDEPGRGFSFRFEGPLDMRMDTTRGQSVAQWLADAPTQDIATVIRDLGEERFAAPIARAIDARRKAHGPLSTTSELAQLVAETVKTREAGQNPATRTFQAFRIFINGELDELQAALEASLEVLQPGGRLGVISFHSLEDRIVKQFIAQHSREVYDRRAPFAVPQPMKLQALRRLRPSAQEVSANPRSRSAIMRVALRTAA